MSHIVPYINFADQGREAVEFYKSIFGGDAEVILVKDSPAAAQMPADWAERIMHLDFKSDDIHFMGSDIVSDQAGKVAGNQHMLALMCDSEAQVHEYFDKLVTGGSVTWAPAPSEWGSVFGQGVDKFGVSWMLEFNKS